MNKKELLQELENQKQTDPETAHYRCDEAILEFLNDNGYADIAQKYKEVVRSHSWWAHA